MGKVKFSPASTIKYMHQSQTVPRDIRQVHVLNLRHHARLYKNIDEQTDALIETVSILLSGEPVKVFVLQFNP